MDEKFNGDKNFVFEPTWAITMIMLPICNALALTHSSQVYHMDLKPDNIMFIDDTKSGIKIADWGLVKGNAIDRRSLELTAVTSDGQIGGTPGYCSPNNGLFIIKTKLTDVLTFILSALYSMKC